MLVLNSMMMKLSRARMNIMQFLYLLHLTLLKMGSCLNYKIRSLPEKIYVIEKEHISYFLQSIPKTIMRTFPKFNFASANFSPFLSELYERNGTKLMESYELSQRCFPDIFAYFNSYFIRFQYFES